MNNIVDMTEMRELNTQMENFKNNGPIDANINPITQQNRKGFKDRISGLLDIFKK